MLKKIGVKFLITSKQNLILQAKKLILPGVGSFNNAMNKLKESDLLPVLNESVLKNKTPILGICLGMQLFAKHSEEGQEKGLGWLDARVIRFNYPSDSKYKIPHMGWNYINLQRENCLFDKYKSQYRFYFVHSYHLICNDNNNILATTNYGISFTSIVTNDNILGVQFHPEKSHKYGMQFLKNFAEKFPC